MFGKTKETKETSYMQPGFNFVKFTGKTNFYTSKNDSILFKCEIENKDGVKTDKCAINAYFVNVNNAKSVRYVIESLASIALAIGGESYLKQFNDKVLSKAMVKSNDEYGFKLKEESTEFLEKVVEQSIKGFGKKDTFVWIGIKGKQKEAGSDVFYLNGMVNFQSEIEGPQGTLKVPVMFVKSEKEVIKTETNNDGWISFIEYSSEEGTMNRKMSKRDSWWIEMAEEMDSNSGMDMNNGMDMSTGISTENQVDDLPF